MNKIILFLFFFLNGFLLNAQVILEGKINHQGVNVQASCYTNGGLERIPINDNQEFQYTLPRFEESLMVFYAKGFLPLTISINTRQSCPTPIPLSISLDRGNMEDTNYLIEGPRARYTTTGTAYQKEKFDLDTVKDKLAYATMMSDLTKDMKDFYIRNKLVSNRKGETTASVNKLIQKTEFRIGQEIYHLLKEKRSARTKLDQQKAAYQGAVEEGLAYCLKEFNYLKAEAVFRSADFHLAEKEMEKEKLFIRRQELSGQPTNDKKVIKAEQEVKTKKRQYEIAKLNMINKQADCWELKLQNELAASLKDERIDATVTKLKQLEISNVRLRKRKENARQLHKEHNALANDLTGRDRVVELANAQKYISEQEEINLFLAENQVKKWNYKNQAANQFNNQLNLARKNFERQREVAWQAEMAYLEHMWHLRDIPEVKDDLNQVFNMHNDILAVALKPRPEFEAPPIESIPTAEISNEAILSNIKVSKRTQGRTSVKEVVFEEDVYEIVENSTGKRTYTKNGNPITRLTYEFETKRKFGKILENVRQEERKKKLWELFKRRIE